MDDDFQIITNPDIVIPDNVEKKVKKSKLHKVSKKHDLVSNDICLIKPKWSDDIDKKYNLFYSLLPILRNASVPSAKSMIALTSQKSSKKKMNKSKKSKAFPFYRKRNSSLRDFWISVVATTATGTISIRNTFPLPFANRRRNA